MVAAAGPAVNLLIALIFALVLRAADPLALTLPMISILEYIVYINLLLMCFNLLPLPPLDGSKILKALLPFNAARAYQQFLYTVESYGLFAAFATLFLFIYVLAAPFSIFVGEFFTLLTGRIF
jgi:Zn-dependent protease